MSSTLRTRVGGAARLVGILAGLATPPVLLATVIGDPLPAWPVDWAAAVAAVRAGMVASSVWVDVLAFVAWTVWAVLLAMLALEVVAVVRDRPSPAGVPSWVRWLAQLLVSGVLTVAGPPQPVLAAATAGTGVPVATAKPTVPGPTSPASPADGRLVTVGEGDSWAGLAADVLGDPSLGGALRNANIGRQVGHGHTIADDTAFVEPGWQLLVPAALDVQSVDPPAPSPAAGETSRHQAGDVVEVQPGDHFWSIAEDTLAGERGRTPTDAETADYWRGLVDANRHRLAPPHDPDLIYPGEHYVLPPADAETTDAAAAEPSDPPPDLPAAAGTDGARAAADTMGLSGPTDQQDEGRVEDPTCAAQDVPHLNGTPDLAGPPPGRPLPQPGQAAPHAGAHPRPTVASTAAAVRSADKAHGYGTAARVVVFAGLGIAAAGVIAVLRRLRTVRLRRRPPGTAPSPPPPTGTERQLHAAADPDTVYAIDRVLRDLASKLDPEAPPQIVGVHYTGQQLTVMLEQPAPPPDGWQAPSDLEWIRRLDEVDQATLADAAHYPGPLPTLVTIGHIREAILLLHLEQLTVTELHGPPDQVADILATIAVELATSPLATDVRVVCVGFGSELASLDRIDVVDVDDSSRLLDDLADLVDETLPLAAARPATAPALAGRIDGVADSWIPTVVLDPVGAVAAEVAELARRIPHAGLAAVAGNVTLDADWQLEVDADRIRIRRPDQLADLTRQRTSLTAAQVADIGRLIDHARNSDEVAYPDLTISHEPNGSVLSDQPPAAAQIEQGPVEVHVLGTVRIDGTEPFRRSRSAELVAYLALHPRGVAADTLMEALWPGEPPDNDRLNRVTSDARTTLDAGPDGRRHLPRIEAGLYRVANSVGCDLHRFHQLVEAAKHQCDDHKRATLKAALELVDGEPFSGTRPGTYSWAHAEGHVTAACVAIDEAARTLAELCLAVDDYEGARWAATRGLAGNPGSINLYKIRLRVAGATGNLLEAEAVMAEARAKLAEDDGPEFTDILIDDLTDLYNQIQTDRIAI
ncbi:MAG: hypothetical protein KY462_13685 [Actinobacteria bacterium]|nr:hypothetical protein [Actinomycetota bacterium]